MDLKVLNYVNQFAGRWAWLDLAGQFFAENAIVVLFALVLLFWFFDKDTQKKKNRYAVILALESIIIGRGILTVLIRSFLPRVRPFVENHITLLINQSPLEASFPSGHAVMAFTLSLPFLIYNRKAGIWFFLLAVLISVSRVFAGVHYPSDILGGFVLSLIVVLFLNYFRNFFIAPIVKFLSRQ